MTRPIHYRFTLLAIAVLAVAFSFVAAPASSIKAQDDFKAAEKDYQTAKRDQSRTAMERAIDRIGQSNDKKAVKFLLGELDWDQKQRKGKRAGLPGNVRDKIIGALSAFTDEESVAEIGKAALALKSANDPPLALDQFDFFKALAGMKDSAAADKTLRDALADPKNPYIKCAALEAIRQANASRFVPEVSAILLETNEEWAKKWLIVPINVFACLQDIVDSTDKDQIIAVVEAVIVWEERKTCNDERVRFFGGRMLTRLTDEVADMSSTHFWKWWVAQMKAGVPIDSTQKPQGKADRTAATPPPAFDVQPVGKRFVFCIDISGSMDMPLKITLDELEKRRKDRGPATGRKQDKGADEAEDEEDNNPLRQLPWKEIKTKMHLAREELARAIKSFAGDREFAIITYATEVEVITNGWIKATQANCDAWSKKAKELEADGMTNIHGACMRALKISGKGIDTDHPAVDPNCVVTGADTIIFLTDGWASWDDFSTGRTRDKRIPNAKSDDVGDGPFIYGEDIWPDVLRHNIFRKVIINTVGIGNHDAELMKQLARRTGGVYVDWSFPE